MAQSIKNKFIIPDVNDVCIQENRIAIISNLTNLPLDIFLPGIILLSLNLLLLG